MKPSNYAVVLAAAGMVALTACSDATDTGLDGRLSDPGTDGRVPVVQIAQGNLTLTVGDSARFTLLPLLPPGIIPKDVRWSSSTSAVTVRQISSTAAVAKAVRTGRAIVHANAADARDSVVVMVQ